MRTPIVALVRVSTSEQSVSSQRAEIERWARAREVEVSEWVEEAGVSGASSRRPELDELMRDVRRGRVGTVVVAELSRLSRRGLAHVAFLIEELTASGVALVALREGIDTSTPGGRMQAQMAGIFAEFERERLKERQRAGIAAARARGQRFGRPPVLVWDEAVLGRLSALLESGVSVRSIARDRRLRVPTVDGGWKYPSRAALRGAVKRLEEVAS